MPGAATHLLARTRLPVSRLKALLGTELHLEAEHTHTLTRTWYDTFDGRLNYHHGVLEADRHGHELQLNWRQVGSDAHLAVEGLDKIPRFAFGLPPGSFGDRLRAVAKMRALLPLASARVRRHVLRLLDARAKTVLRVLIEELRLLDPDGQPAERLGRWVRLQPVRGYAWAARRAAAILKPELEGGTEDPFVEVLRLLGIPPGGRNPSWRVSLRADTPSDIGVAAVLTRYLDIMEANQDGLIADLDSEFLHDFRVAVRRTRSILAQAGGVFPARDLGRYQNAFSWLGKLTGTHRDLDVFLLGFDDAKGLLPGAQREQLEPLRDFLGNHQVQAHRTLVRGLESRRYQRFRDDWRAYLDQVPLRKGGPRDSDRPLIEIASQAIWKIYRRTCKQGRVITTASPAGVLHDLRKTCKRLRYLMEAFQSIYPEGKMTAVIRELKHLQDVLGEIADCNVQRALLATWEEELRGEALAPAGTIAAMGVLADRIGERERTARGHFDAAFQEFMRTRNRNRFRRLFRDSSQ